MTRDEHGGAVPSCAVDCGGRMSRDANVPLDVDLVSRMRTGAVFDVSGVRVAGARRLTLLNVLPCRRRA